ncbi:hypothetical protein A3860_09510 [Niastella vici]|uniref:DUF262 domain-containing protein n=1 Tax=Niastella vici TaxID=1703345 RepID=A0A1V9FEW0_9BACT|nr:DUF262 domain-containing protein [Niastella vici]OQP56811.1 hypothetical protein A3860_09510 [Niastella vici]
MDIVNSELYDIKSIIQKDFRYNIPRYQRLYVWKEEQVNTLFHDILIACKANKDIYYIGGIITVKYQKIENCFDLVDGQQRFTTLWLLANELGESIKDFTRTVNGLRLNFSIRKNVEMYFNQLLSGSESIENDTEFDDLVRLSKARKIIGALITENLQSKELKNKYIYFLLQKVKMVITEVPPSTDLNKLFETLNNRGIQLAQHEILKTHFLSKIGNSKKRYRYGILWNACSDMNNYIERSLTYETGYARGVANTYDQWVHDWKQIENILIDEKAKAEKLTLQDIIGKRKNWDEAVYGDEEPDFEEMHPNATDDELEPVRSILTFPQLLLHTLRVYLHRNQRIDIQRINEKELLHIYSEYFFLKNQNDYESRREEDETESIAFMDLLFKMREAFDKYIIKWVEVNDMTEIHLIKKVYKQNQKKKGWFYYLRRQKTQELDGFAMLQSILYHSQQNTTQYWLTPFLNWLLEFPSFDDAFAWLKVLDNILFSSMQEGRELIDRTKECMDGYPDIEPTTKVLTEALGTSFPHYWFYKLEFVLWHERVKFNKSEEWKEYRITAKNSVEHISPQSPRNSKDKLCDTQLHNFGNLALVTRSINSEYSDFPYGVKKAKFEDKKSKGTFDSLKSDIIYQYPIWNDKLALNHQSEMINLLQEYFEKTKRKY